MEGRGPGFKWQLIDGFLILRETKDESCRFASYVWDFIINLPLPFDPVVFKKEDRIRILICSLKSDMTNRWCELGQKGDGWAFKRGRGLKKLIELK